MLHCSQSMCLRVHLFAQMLWHMLKEQVIFTSFLSGAKKAIDMKWHTLQHMTKQPMDRGGLPQELPTKQARDAPPPPKGSKDKAANVEAKMKHMAAKTVRSEWTLKK